MLGLNLPLAHAVHSVARVPEKLPGAQACGTTAGSAHRKPFGQPAHSERPSSGATSPSAQGVHADRPVVLVNCPRLQASHCVAFWAGWNWPSAHDSHTV